MDSFSLYDDFPLFSGDLALVGMSPLADELPIIVQDELQPKQLPGVQPIENHIQGSLSKQPKKEVSIKIDINNVNWLDTKVDLLELLQEAEREANDPEPEAYHQLTSNLENYNPLGSQATADELYNVTEMLASDLQSVEYAAPDGSSSPDQISPQDQLLHACNLADLNAAVFGDDDIVDEEMDSILSNSSLLSAAPILSPVSPEDIESVLSSGPTSPSSFLDSESESSVFVNSATATSTIDAKYLKEELSKPALEKSIKKPSGTQRSQRQRIKYEPYSPPPPEKSPRITSQARSTDSKQRKKQQNKDAALRYRQKKKQEKCSIFEECDQLEQKNTELKDKVDSMTREIQYLKDLLAEVYQAKSGSKSQSSH